MLYPDPRGLLPLNFLQEQGRRHVHEKRGEEAIPHIQFLMLSNSDLPLEVTINLL